MIGNGDGKEPLMSPPKHEKCTRKGGIMATYRGIQAQTWNHGPMNFPRYPLGYPMSYPKVRSIGVIHGKIDGLFTMLAHIRF